MKLFEELKTWYRWGYWLDTPQGISVLLSVPICWTAALVSVLLPAGSRPIYLESGPVAFLFVPVLAFLYFVRFGQWQERPYSASWLTTAAVVLVVLSPFVYPYLRSH